MDLGVVVPAQLLLLLLGPGAYRDLDVAVGVLAAHHEADLAGWVGRNGGVGVLCDGEDLLAVLLQLGDQGQVEPLVLSCSSSVSTISPYCRMLRCYLGGGGAMGPRQPMEGRTRSWWLARAPIWMVTEEGMALQMFP